MLTTDDPGPADFRPLTDVNQLTDNDRGNFRVNTEHSYYEIFLGNDKSTLVRHSRNVEGRSNLRQDVQPTTLSAIVRCVVGSSAVLDIIIDEAKKDSNYLVTRRITTPVDSIERLDD